MGTHFGYLLGCSSDALLARVVGDIATAHEGGVNGFLAVSTTRCGVEELCSGGMGRQGREEGSEVGFVDAVWSEGSVAWTTVIEVVNFSGIGYGKIEEETQKVKVDE